LRRTSLNFLGANCKAVRGAAVRLATTSRKQD
jgi:hypothetical protein